MAQHCNGVEENVPHEIKAEGCGGLDFILHLHETILQMQQCEPSSRI